MNGHNGNAEYILGDLNVRLKYKKGESEDWTKIEDKALRKKIQDRFAKRKSSASSCLLSWSILGLR